MDCGTGGAVRSSLDFLSVPIMLMSYVFYLIAGFASGTCYSRRFYDAHHDFPA